MNAAREKKSNDPLIGYFGSVAVAVMVSGFLAGFLTAFAENYFPNLSAADAKTNLSAGFFIAIAFSNPIGAHLSGSGWLRSIIRFPIGFVGGFAIQELFLTPVAGNTMSPFMLLLVSAFAVPGILMVGWTRRFLDRNGILPSENLATAVIRVLSWPDRVLFIFLMGISFALFWRFSATPSQVMIVLGAVLVALTLWVTMRQVPELLGEDREKTEHRAWLALEPDAEGTLTETAIARVKYLVQAILPGAILFGGVTRLAVEFLAVIYPDLNIDFADPAAAAQSIALVLAIGLGVIFFGMVAALGFCLFVIQMIGQYKGWSKNHLRENYLQMIRAMYFRPLNRT